MPTTDWSKFEKPLPEPLPPWERDHHWTDVPCVMMRLYGRAIKPITVQKWMSCGLVTSDGATQKDEATGKVTRTRVYLNKVKRAGRTYVRVKDLQAFCEAT